MIHKEIQIQRDYYRETAEKYDQMHICGNKPILALGLLLGVIDYMEINTVLDIGSGTGRAIRYIKQKRTDVKVIGIEPVKELRNVGYQNGLQVDELQEGDATMLPFHDGAFDLVCEFGVLHHVKYPRIVVAEMIRVAQKAIFISDSNNFGQGSWLKRSVKQILNKLGLWHVTNLLKTKGKGYQFSSGDGLSYSYSVFNDYSFIKNNCYKVHLLDTCGLGINPYRTAEHVTLLGIKQPYP